jgi:hypothetical protein
VKETAHPSLLAGDQAAQEIISKEEKKSDEN